MKYSVIIPCYNTGSIVEKAVMSIQSSGLAELEILLIDDGSNDNTPALCDRLAAENDNIRAIHQPNAGVSAARNRGIEEAKGEYIWFFDSDDLVDEGSMTRAAQIVSEQKPDMLMFGMSFDYYAGKRMYQRLELYYDEERLMTPAQVQETFSELYQNNMLTPCWNKLFRREMLLEHGVRFHPDLFVMEDFHFSLSALQHCQNVYSLPQVIYRYRQSDAPGDNRAAKRVNRIENLPAYMAHFEPLLSKHPDILTSVFFMLLRQKLSVQSQSEIAKTAEHICNSFYAHGNYESYYSTGDKEIMQKLQSGRDAELWRIFRKSQIRSLIVGAAKRTTVYAWLKGNKPRRVIW